MVLSINNYILLTLLALSVYFDVTQKRIPNFLTLPVMGWGLVSYIVIDGFSGFTFSLFGFLLGLGIFLIPYMAGGMGGGDVKLMAAIGALKGAEFIFLTAIFTAFCGGVMAVGYLLYKRRLLHSLKKVVGILAVPLFNALAFRLRAPFLRDLASYFSPPEKETLKKAYVPYGVAIALGTIIVLSGLGEWVLPSPFF